MGQIEDGVRAVLSKPVIYEAFQWLMGGRAARATFVRRNVRPTSGMNVLDIGCGPAGILDYLPSVTYWGFDVNSSYIDAARRRFGNRGTFHARRLGESDLASMPRFDLVLALGVVHHLGDDEARGVMQLAAAALKPAGRLVTLDPCLEPGQNPIARFLIHGDRGRNVRTRGAYEALAADVFSRRIVEVRHTTWIPYTHCIMECSR